MRVLLASRAQDFQQSKLDSDQHSIKNVLASLQITVSSIRFFAFHLPLRPRPPSTGLHSDPFFCKGRALVAGLRDQKQHQSSWAFEVHYWHQQQQSQPRAFFIRSFFIPRVSLSWRVQASCSLELKRQGWVELERGARGAADATASEGIGKFFLFSHDQKLLYRGFEHNFYFRNTLESFPFVPMVFRGAQTCWNTKSFVCCGIPVFV